MSHSGSKRIPRTAAVQPRMARSGSSGMLGMPKARDLGMEEVAHEEIRAEPHPTQLLQCLHALRPAHDILLVQAVLVRLHQQVGGPPALRGEIHAQASDGHHCSTDPRPDARTGADRCDVDARIDTVLGDHAAYRAAFDAIQAAIAAEDGICLRCLGQLPDHRLADGEEMVIADAEQFAEHFDNIVTDEIATAISAQKWAALFVNAEGLMYGNGQVWLNGICEMRPALSSDVKRSITIQSTPISPQGQLARIRATLL